MFSSLFGDFSGSTVPRPGEIFETLSAFRAQRASARGGWFLKKRPNFLYFRAHFQQQFLREIFRNRPDHGYPFCCGHPFGPCRAKRIRESRGLSKRAFGESFYSPPSMAIRIQKRRTWHHAQRHSLVPQKLDGKKKAHKHKSFWPVTRPVTAGSPDREARGQSFMYCRRNPRNINLFVRIPDREDR